ncbi:MAG TPA: hypothetical protein VKE74_08665 [Gemmataceae bacterium]|nr:hypothetical protein [Gemmataceae bacterium]
MRRACCLLLGAALGLSALHAADPLPVPDEAAQAKAEKVVRDLYKEDYTKKKPAEQVEFARKLLKVADDTRDNPAARFVMYREARDLAARAGDLDLALDAGDTTAKVFAVNVIEFKTAALQVADRTPTVPARDVAETALEIVDDAVKGDDYAGAAKLLELAARAAGRARVPGLNELVAGRVKEVDSIRKAFDATEPDRKALKANPDDPAAAAKVGRFLCLVKGDWDAGLPLLAKGNDPKLKAAAEKDLAKPDAATARMEVGDAWWDLGETLEAAERAEARLRARHWYTQAVADLTGLTKSRIEKRLDETSPLAEQRLSRNAVGGWMVIFRSADPSIWNTTTNRARNQFALPLNQVPSGIRFLRLTELAKGNFVIIEMTRERLGNRTEANGYGWIGTNDLQFKGYHLGIYDTAWKDIPQGSICVYHSGGFDGFRGWGFGHRSFTDDQQGYSWDGKPTASTVFEVAVKTTPLSTDESRRLLKKKK